MLLSGVSGELRRALHEGELMTERGATDLCIPVTALF
jgi:hypothetical protein